MQLVGTFMIAIAASVPAAATAEIQVAAQCLDLPEARPDGATADLAWFEVYYAGNLMQPGPAAARLGHFTAAELAKRLLKCRVNGHDYAFEMSGYSETKEGLIEDYRVALWIDGKRVWPEADNGHGFVGTIRVDHRSVAICSVRSDSAGHGQGAVGQPRTRAPTLAFSAQTAGRQTCHIYEPLFP